ncbi:hypothetical protein SASPL_121507 [Salvia splendens]|uniref:Bidirectional sugar transporter SWEET n=1 Tax=Salvia splendens TaxID=180675 RepID=A0A8X8ZWL8_SALSN|nr:hypothetical protein SASPL_121507 [Salvia splendens]
MCFRVIRIAYSDIQEDHHKQINRAILRAALHLRPLELLDMPLLKVVGLLLGVFAVFAVIVSISLCVFEPPNRQLFVGYLSVFSLISMFASPLFIINLVIRTKSVEYMPYYLSLATFLMSIAFFAYGMLKHDAFVSVSLFKLLHPITRCISNLLPPAKNQIPNGIGAVLGILQLVLYFHYSRTNAQLSRTPLLEPYTV